MLLKTSLWVCFLEKQTILLQLYSEVYLRKVLILALNSRDSAHGMKENNGDIQRFTARG